MPLKDRNGVFPPGGWTFFQPEMNWHAPVGLTFKQCVDAIIAQRLRNPRFGLPTDWNIVAGMLDYYTCTRINWDPHYCFRENEAQKKTLPHEDQPQSKPELEAVQPAGAIKAYSAGAQIQAEWFGDGGKPVSQELAESRARTCTSLADGSPCPFNTTKGNWKTKVGKTVAKAILEHLRHKNELDLKVSNEDKLGTCHPCLCHLPLKVWTPLKHILNNTSQETLSKFHPKCWILNESKKKIICVIPFHNGDVKLTEKLLVWIKKLGGCPQYPCILLADWKITNIWIAHLKKLADACFGSVSVVRVPVGPDSETWPIGPNWMHRAAREHIAAHRKLPWLWLEPDSVPLKPNWLDSIQAEYDRCGKPCLGAVIKPEEPHLPKYLAGVAVYPEDARNLFEESDIAFDVARPDKVVPLSHPSKLIQHRWGLKGLPPTFKPYVEPTDPINTLTTAAISKEAVLFHRCKDGSLIERLSE